MKRYIVTEVVLVFFAIVVVLSLIMSSFQFSQLVAKVAAGEIAGAAVYQLFGLQVVKYAVLVLPGAFFIAMLAVMTQLANNNELIAMRAVGYSDWQLYKALFSIAAPLAILIATMTLYGLPKVVEFSDKLLKKAQASSQLTIMQPGQFRRLGNDMTLFVSDAQNDAFSQLFVWHRQGGNESVTVAETGQQYNKAGRRYMGLQQGSSYSLNADGSTDWMRFDTLSMLLPAMRDDWYSDSTKARSTRSLLNDPSLKSRIEFQRRLSPAISVLLLALLAPLLVAFNPRNNHYGRFAIAIMAYILYTNYQFVLKSFVADGTIPIFPGLYTTHLVLFGLILIWLFIRALRFR